MKWHLLIMIWDPFFKPETRSRGQKLSQSDLIKIAAPSDTEILGLVKGYRVRFHSATVTSSIIQVQCSCSKKMCQHAWATLLKAVVKHPDFFDQKNEILDDNKMSSSTHIKKILLDKQRAYRKEQYQKNKQKLKQREVVKVKSYPLEVERALKYFSDNGIVFEIPEDIEMIQSSKKKLARIFHPDRGGRHEEIVQLNHYSDILLNYFGFSP